MAKDQPKTRSLHGVVKATGWVSLFTDLSSDMIYPLLPEFVVGRLGATKALFGLVEGLAEGIPAFVKYFSGWLADRTTSRKWLVLVGYSLSSAVKPLIGFAGMAGQVLAPFWVMALRALDRVGKGVRGAPRDAIVADYSEGEQGRAFGYQRAMDHAGAVGGGLVAFCLIGLLKLDVSWAIAWSFLPGIAAVLAIALFVHDRPEHAVSVKARSKATEGEATPLGGLFQRYMVAAVLFALANSSDAFLLLRARELGMKSMYLPLAWVVLHLVKTATSYHGGVLSDRVGRRPVLAGGWLLYAGVYFGFSFLGSLALLWILFAVYGVFFGATEGVAKAFVADLIPAGARGTAFGRLGMVEGLVLIPTSVLVGYLWDRTGSGHLPLLLNAVFALCAAVWLLVMVHPARPTAPPA